MCKLGGGDENRCLKHHPVTKFVVKIVAVRTKADNETIDDSIKVLNKEGRNAPSPEPAVVESWIETEKFKAQYDPDLSEHDRKIQMNRLNGASPEKVKGNHFHVWKNLEKAVRTKMAQRIAAAGLVVGMSVSLVGCFANGSNNNEPFAPTNSPVTNSAPETNEAPTVYGHVVGTGKQIKMPDGSYETITLDKNSPAYEYNGGQGNPDYMKEEGWSEKDGIAAQHKAVNYMVEEYVDSTTLEGGAKDYKKWYETTAKKYFASDVYKEPGIKDGSAQVILGNATTKNGMPTLIHDGTPRQKNLDVSVYGFGPYTDEEGYKGVQFTIEYTAEYRVDDVNAAKFVGLHRGMSGDEFLKSGKANDALKDGVGENTYLASGKANIVLDKDKSGEFKIIGFSAESQFDTKHLTK